MATIDLKAQEDFTLTEEEVLYYVALMEYAPQLFSYEYAHPQVKAKYDEIHGKEG